MKYSAFLIFLSGLAFALAGCTRTAPEEAAMETAALPNWTFSPEMIFPADRSLSRPEDGVILPDGRLVVTDDWIGLRLLNADGTSRPFGKLPEAGYANKPPEIEGAANGVSMDPTGTYLLVADVYQGGIYEVDIATETTEKIFQHEFGVNSVRADSLGGIWFSQSTRNRPEENAAGLWSSVNIPVADGALCYLPPEISGEAREAVVLVDDIVFGNGLALDEEAGVLYQAETMGSRIWKYAVDVAAGTVSDRAVAFEVSFPDNIELDAQGRLWIACPLQSEIVVADPATGNVQSVFRISSPESERVMGEIRERLAAGQPWLDLAGPPLWSPAPAFITGMVLDPENATVYATGLGDAIIKLEE